MRIWGASAGPSRRRKTEAQHDDIAPKCVECSPMGVGTNAWLAGANDGMLIAMHGNACAGRSPAALSDGALRLVRKMEREPAVDLRLECPPLRSAADIRAVVRAAVRSSACSLRTLSFGPWLGNFDSAPPCCGSHNTDENGLSEDANLAVKAFVASSSQWSQWSLRSITIAGLRLADANILLKLLARVPVSVVTLRLVDLSLGRNSSLMRDCVQVICSMHKEPFHLDLGNNGLGDSDIELLLPLFAASAESQPATCVAALRGRPLLSGLSLAFNPGITSSGLRQLLAAAGSSLSGLERLDMSECGLGVDAVPVLIEGFMQPGLASLRDVELYRVGLDSHGLVRLVDAATRAPAVRHLNLTANSQHAVDWLNTIGRGISAVLSEPGPLRVLTLSCPEKKLDEAREMLACPERCRVILVPNEQNNYNRELFMGHVH